MRKDQKENKKHFSEQVLLIDSYLRCCVERKDFKRSTYPRKGDNDARDRGPVETVKEEKQT